MNSPQQTTAHQLQPAHLALPLIIITLLAATACQFFSGPDELNPVPDYGTLRDPYPVSFIWQEYQGANSGKYANDKYKGQWIWLEVDGVKKVDGRPAGIDVVTPQSLLLRTPGTIKEIELKFRFFEDTDHDDIEEGETPVLLCQGGGTDVFGSTLIFNHCRRADQVEDKSEDGKRPYSEEED